MLVCALIRFCHAVRDENFENIGKRALTKLNVGFAMIRVQQMPYATANGTTCSDTRRLMPACNSCIPGLSEDESESCTLLTDKTSKLRNEIADIAKERFGEVDYHLYPYLSVDPLTQRQKDVAALLAEDRPTKIIDIGPYTNPIWKFFHHGYCPELVVSIEPCGEVATDSQKAW